jgi:hypothetical protein
MQTNSRVQGASLLILNWRRPENIQKILAAETKYASVEEILVFNNNSELAFHYPHPKVKILNASCDFGLRSRWIIAALASNECLVFQDDDILLPELVFQKFTQMISSDGERAYSLHGRNPSADNKYNYRQAVGDVEIVLTRATSIHKDVVPLIFSSEQRLLKSGFRLPSINGEDIFLSYCLTAHFRKKHRVLELPSEELPSPNALWRKPGHLRERTAIMRACKNVFSV